MSSTQRRRGPGASTEAVAVWAGLVAAGLLLALTNAAERLTGAAGLPANPISLTVAVVTGRAPWGVPQTLAATAIVLLLTAAGAAAAWWWQRRRGGRPRVDRAAAHLAHRGDLAAYTLPGAASTAARLGYAALPPGLPLGRTVAGGVRLVADWETVAVHIAGPRTGKTTAAVIPAVLHAPGPVLVTSNKRDVVDATRGPREAAGPVWVFDPQGVVGAEPTWWWNPLSFVTDEVKGAQLARLWAHAAREPGARTDDYFSKAGPSLLAGMLLAAATDHRPITQVYRWLLDPADDTPARILRGGHPLAAEALEAIAKVNPRQRDGVYSGAAELVSFLTSRAAVTWVETPAAAPSSTPPRSSATAAPSTRSPARATAPPARSSSR